MIINLKNNIILIIINLFFFNCVYSDDNMFDNFDNKNTSKWEFISDNIMGGVSFGKIDFLSENKQHFLRMTGFVSLENNGGFIQVRRKVSRKKNAIKNGIKVIVRGNDMNYYIHLRTKFTLLPWQYYQTKINVTEDWEEANLKIKDFKRSGFLLPKFINAKNITSIAIVAFGKEHQARIDVKKVMFY